MWLLRLLAVLTVLTVAGGVVAFLFTHDARYLHFAWRLFRYSLLVALLVFALMIIERVAIIPA
jgi:heme O synthase-like polyprenyltransferase